MSHLPSSAGGHRAPVHRLVPNVAMATACLLSAAFTPSAQAEMARQADSFVESIGVNTHIGVSGVYGSPTPDILRQSGIRYIRNNRSAVPSLYEGDAYGNKIKTLVVVDSQNMNLADLVTWLGRDDVLAVEGFNEPDNWGRSWSGSADIPASGDYSGTRAFQRDLYDAAKASASAKLKPILAPGMGWWRRAGMLSPVPFDKLSFHSYLKGQYPGASLLDVECIPYGASMVATGQSAGGIWTTEAGYNNALNSSADHRPVTEAAAANYIPRLLALNFNRRIEKTFIYEFIDGGTNLANVEHRFGLLRNDRSKKPSYWAVKNLISLLNDKGAPFQPGALNLTLTGDTTNVNRTLLQKRNGDYYLLLWTEVSSCDHTTTPPQDLTVPPASVTLGFGTTAGAVTIYSNLEQETYTSVSHSNISSLALDVPDKMLVVKISGIAGSGSGVPVPAAGPDLVITKTWTVPAEPLVTENPTSSEETTLHAIVHNRGGAAVGGSSVVKMRLNGSSNFHALTFNVPDLAAGGSATVQSTGVWSPPAAGHHNFAFNITAPSGVTETNARNNGHLLTIPVLSHRWPDPCDSLANWTASDPGRWVVQTVGARTYFANTSTGVNSTGSLTHTPATPLTTNWKLDFEYNWRWGDGAYNLSVMADVLDSGGNGYRVRVRQGVAPTPGNVGKLIQIFKVTGHVAAFSPLAEGPGYDRPGDATSQNFMPVSLIFDRATQSLSVYMDLDGDGVLEQSIPPVRDVNTPTTTFHKVVLSAYDGQNANTIPKFDNVRLSRGMLNLAPAPYFTDRLVNLDQWTDVTNWTTATTGDLTYVQTTAQYASGTMTHVFPTMLTQGWTLGFDYDFRWGGAGSSQSLKWGHNNVQLRADMLDANNNGYRVTVRQGDSGVAANNGKVISVSKVTNGSATLLGEGIGYNTPGWLSLGRARPDFKRVSFTYNRKMQTLSVLIDVDRNGVMEQIIAPIPDTTYTEFSKLVLSAYDAQGGTPGVGPLFDNIEIGLISNFAAVAVGEGLTNFADYAFGRNPGSPDAVVTLGSIEVIDEQRFLTVRFRRRSQGVTYWVEESPNLVQWAFVDPVTYRVGPVLDHGDGTQTWQVRGTIPLTGADVASSSFLRVSATSAEL